MKNGGPAFPQTMPGTRDQGGMTLRDYFAGEALEGLLSNPNLMSMDDFVAIAEGVKGGRYFIQASSNIADAMLAEREKDPAP